MRSPVGRRAALGLVLAGCLAPVSLVTSGAGAATSDAAARPKTTFNYVALGDSYSSGEGVEPFIPGSGACDRSPRAYSQVVHLPTHLTVKRFFYACSGAETTAFTQPFNGFPAELDHSAIGPSTDLVTLSIGGNDAGFAQVLTDCSIMRLSHCTFSSSTRRRVLASIDALPAKLVPAYQAIKARAPNAAVVVLGYPQLFTASYARFLMCKSIIAAGFTRTAQNFVREAGYHLRDAIDTATRRAGVYFIDMIPAFQDHETCGKDGQWINAIVGHGQGSFHPNARGQQAYADALDSELSILTVLGRGIPMLPGGLPANPPPG